MPAIQFANKGASLLAAPVAPGDTVITVFDASTYPPIVGTEYFYMVLEAIDLTSFEVVKVTLVVGNTVTIERAQGGTLAGAFAIGDYAENRITKTTLDEFLQREADTIDGGLFT